MPREWDWSVYSAHADDLWVLASSVTEGLDDGRSLPPAKRTFAALSVILFAAMTIEAFLNDLAFVAEGTALGDALAEVEQSRGSVQLKLLVATIALGRPIDRGLEPYQSFQLLFDVRNALVHLKPKVKSFVRPDRGMEPRKLLAELHRRNLIGDPGGNEWFLELLGSRTLCAWALRTTHDVVGQWWSSYRRVFAVGSSTRSSPRCWRPTRISNSASRQGTR
jgi:hypothetical protein